MNDSSAADGAGAGVIDDRMPSFAEAFRVWLRIGLLSFGGPAGQIALLHREVVDERHWVGERRFLHALNFCTLLPGPEAQQLATYLGWLLHGVKGGLAAGILFVLPGAVGHAGAVAASTPLVGEVPRDRRAVLRPEKRGAGARGRGAAADRPAGAEGPGRAWALAVAAFIALFFLHLPLPAVVVLAAG